MRRAAFPCSQELNFAGTSGAVGTVGDFNFPGWRYQGGQSNDRLYTNSIFEQTTNSQTFSVVGANGVRLCVVAAAGCGGGARIVLLTCGIHRSFICLLPWSVINSEDNAQYWEQSSHQPGWLEQM